MPNRGEAHKLAHDAREKQWQKDNGGTEDNLIVFINGVIGLAFQCLHKTNT